MVAGAADADEVAVEVELVMCRCDQLKVNGPACTRKQRAKRQCNIVISNLCANVRRLSDKLAGN
jgi:hypothetical protein